MIRLLLSIFSIYISAESKTYISIKRHTVANISILIDQLIAPSVAQLVRTLTYQHSLADNL